MADGRQRRAGGEGSLRPGVAPGRASPTRVRSQRHPLHEVAGDIDSEPDVRSTVFIQTMPLNRAVGPEEMARVGEDEFAQGLAGASASGLYDDASGRGSHRGPSRRGAGLAEALQPWGSSRLLSPNSCHR